MSGHCFISYTNAKAEQDVVQLALKLADKLKGEPPHFDVWIDNRSIQAGNWDEQVSDDIKTCKCMLFIVSPDSVTPNSICADEVDWALRYKKTIIPLIADQNAEIPFRLSRRKFIDFTGDFEIALSQLRNLIAWLDTPEGELHKLKDRLADAQRDLRRHPEQTARIEKEIEELNTSIQAQQKIVDNPKKAEEQTQANIAAGLERERKPQLPLASYESKKFINPAPGIAPNYFQDRTVETKQIFDFLNNASQRMMTIVGRGGVGKTAMICRLLKYLENGAVPEDLTKSFGELQPLKVDGIVYLSESGSHRVNFANIFSDLCKLLPAETAQQLGSVYKNPQASTESKMKALLEHFQGERVLLLLDNFEPLVDESCADCDLRDAELDEALRAFLNGTHSSVKIIITTRTAPKSLNLVQPGRQRPLDLDDGLDSPYAENILREMDSDGRLGLKSAGAEALDRARIKTRGFPRALEALFAILASDRYTTLDELLVLPLPENVVEALVGEAFNRLDTNAQKVMQALAVYNRPVTPAAVDYLLAPHIPAMDSAPILQRLANMHFARKESGQFYLYTVDRDFVFGLIPTELSKTPDISDVSDVDNDNILDIYKSRFIRQDLLIVAANYFVEVRKSQEECRKLEDLSPQLAEIDLRCAAEDYDTAANVLLSIDFNFLFVWGHPHIVIKIILNLKENLQNLETKMFSLNSLGTAYNIIGESYKAITSYQEAVDISAQIRHRNRGTYLNNLASAYNDAGYLKKSIKLYNKALSRAQKENNKQNQAMILGNLGQCYATLGNIEISMKLLEEALSIVRFTNSKGLEGAILSNLGRCYFYLGDYNKSIDFHRQSLNIAHENREQSTEISHVNTICYISSYLEESRNPEEGLKKSIQFSDSLSIYRMQLDSRHVLAHIYLSQNNLTDAHTTIEAALQYDVQQSNYDVSVLHGIIASRQGEQGDEVTARGAFVRAIGQADEILSKTAEYYSALDAKGLALCGLAILDGGRGTVDGGQETVNNGQRSTVYRQQAIDAFKKARQIAPHAGVVKRVLRLFDELAKCDPHGLLQPIRPILTPEN